MFPVAKLRICLLEIISKHFNMQLIYATISNWVEKIQTILLNDLNMYFHVFEQMFKRLEILEPGP